jgi:4-amino-4-deoxy-L-arabinose transferase-like glycosyltransferase
MKKKVFQSMVSPEFRIIIISLLLYFAVSRFMHIEAYNPDYMPQVESISKGTLFLNEDNLVMDRYPPLYPLYLYFIPKFSLISGISQNSMALIFFMIIQSLNNLVLFYLAGLFLKRRLALASAFVFMLHPFVFFSMQVPLSENLFILFFLLSLYHFFLLFQKESEYLHITYSAIFCGLAMLTRPAALFLPLIFAFVLISSQKNRLRSVRKSLLYVFIVIMLIAPWEIHVFRNNSYWVPLSSGTVQNMKDGLTLNQVYYRHNIQYPEEAEKISKKMWMQFERIEDIGSFVSFISCHLRENFKGVWQLYYIKSLRVWYALDSQEPRHEKRGLLLFFIFFVPALLGIMYFRNSLFLKILWILTCYFWLSASLALSITRYIFPLIPLYSMCIPVFLSEIYNTFAAYSDKIKWKSKHYPS